MNNLTELKQIAAKAISMLDDKRSFGSKGVIRFDNPKDIPEVKYFYGKLQKNPNSLKSDMEEIFIVLR